VLDRGQPAWPDAASRPTAEENRAVEAHLAGFFGDPTWASFYPRLGIGMRAQGGQVTATGDAITTWHAEQVLQRFKPGVLAMTLLDIDTCHADFNGYLQAQQIADACVRHLWDMIQSTDGLRDETALLVLPEHGRHLFSNGQNPDSLGRSGIDHGQGDDGDRDVFLLALGPDFQAGQVIAPIGIAQDGRASGRPETIDVALTAATLLGHGDAMTAELTDAGMRPGLPLQAVFR
jgi:hypothetical protein